MRKYKLFRLCVVEKEGYKFICEIEYINHVNKIYKEVFTQEKIRGKVQPLVDYYSMEQLNCFMLNGSKSCYSLTKHDILLKYLEINKGIIINNKKKSYKDIVIGMWEDYVESKKDSLPDIPIISAKELQKQKTLDKK